MDVLHAHQAGFTNAVALSGTALTDEAPRAHEALQRELHARPRRRRGRPRGDAHAALSRSARACASRRCGCRREGPGRSYQRRPEGFRGSDHSSRSRSSSSSSPCLPSASAIRIGSCVSAERVVLPLIAAIPSPMEREHFVRRPLARSASRPRRCASRSRACRRSDRDERLADKTAPRAPRSAAREVRSDSSPLAVIHAYPDTPLARRVKAEYARITGVEAVASRGSPRGRGLRGGAGTSARSQARTQQTSFSRAFEEAVIREAYQEAVANLRRAEAAGDATRLSHVRRAGARHSRRGSRRVRCVNVYILHYGTHELKRRQEAYSQQTKPLKSAHKRSASRSGTKAHAKQAHAPRSRSCDARSRGARAKAAAAQGALGRAAHREG